MPPRSRLPEKIVCLSSCSRSGKKVRSKPCFVEKGALRSWARERSTSVNEIGLTSAVCVSTAEFQRKFAMATPTHDMNELKRRMQGAIHLLKQELGGLRTGRASASLLEPVQVEAYGSHMPLNQVAT